MTMTTMTTSMVSDSLTSSSPLINYPPLLFFSAWFFCSQMQNEIGLLSTQLRNIERRMLRAARERNTRSLAATGLPFLLELTYRGIFALLDDLAIARTVIVRYLAISYDIARSKIEMHPVQFGDTLLYMTEPITPIFKPII